MWVAQQHGSKEWTAGTQDHFMCLYLFVVNTDKSNISKVLVQYQILECFSCADVKIIPRQVKSFCRHFQVSHFCNLCGYVLYSIVLLFCLFWKVKRFGLAMPLNTIGCVQNETIVGLHIFTSRLPTEIFKITFQLSREKKIL